MNAPMEDTYGRVVRHPNGHLMVERVPHYVPTREAFAAKLASLAKAWPYIAEHAPHIDGEFDNALADVSRMIDALYAALARAALATVEGDGRGPRDGA